MKNKKVLRAGNRILSRHLDGVCTVSGITGNSGIRYSTIKECVRKNGHNSIIVVIVAETGGYVEFSRINKL